MAEKDRADEADAGRAEPGGAAAGHAEGWAGAGVEANSAGAGVAGPGPQSIEATTAALGDMEPSAGSGEGGASESETAGDKS
jgi:hypothetical protein